MKEKEKDLHLKIIYKGKEKLIVMSKEELFKTLAQQIKVEFNIVQNDCDWRLRAYSFYDEIMQESYEGKDDIKLEACNLKDFKYYIIEIKEEGT